MDLYCQRLSRPKEACLSFDVLFLLLDHELEEVPFGSLADLLQVSVEVLVWPEVRSGPVLETNRVGIFADVFFQDTERFLSFGASRLQVGDSVP